ncbi:MAG: dihydrodipicolinate synthase family protein [Microbacterium sp.]|uniref:dihydrodipicolinate synthase family protein n=1 Tax=Microbacterium sp. TaxID=51671 RepID=UPI00260B4954|nr:dihydrodipicolinate synthase family protein [Microbacterium sp.]MDF2561292.1 dihydrodipicolinate synthase family protein [Microbacterium sp.]
MIARDPLASNAQDRLTGVTAVLVTPYRDARVDEQLTETLTREIGSSGVHAIAALGNTAEVFQLTRDEQRAYLRAVARADAPALRIAGFAGAASSVLDEIDYAASLGYDAAMLHEPADPFGDSEGVLTYYLSIAARSALPVVLYLRSPRLDVESLRRVAADPTIVGVKFARSDADTLAQLLGTEAGTACTWVNGGAESKATEFLALGLTGFTSGIANVRPDLALAVHAALLARDPVALELALQLVAPVERIRAAGNGKFNVAVLKELFRLQGTDVGDVRPPHSPLSEEAAAELHRAVAQWPAAVRAGDSVAEAAAVG